MAPTADRTWRVSGTSAWPGRATTVTRTWTRSPAVSTATGADASNERQAGPAASDAEHARDLERGQADHLAHDVLADGQLGAAHETDSRLGLVGDGRALGDPTGALPAASPAKASAMRSGTRVRAIVAATPIP